MSVIVTLAYGPRGLQTGEMTVSIRPASAGDAPRVAQIYVQSWNLGLAQLMPPLVLDGDRISRWAGDLTTGRTRWWVAEWDGSLAGFVDLGHRNPSRHLKNGPFRGSPDGGRR